ncbi:hypothetical protein ACOUAQ_01950 [Acinetobacter baumannii]|uniref:hypothetical protein n=1 Tax=Acinetobacter pittii TaxID=48296 RepID=UPI00194ED171|nr:hypothetical protein [Acinetobacter pittii]QRO95003.1 hypothetical protein I6J47_00700 [Acinetobacter pittii]
MDKCREQFEKQRYWIGLFRDAVDFDEELGRYVLNGQRKLYAFHLDSFNEKWAIWQEAWQHQQAKVEELQRRNQMLNDNIKEQGQKLVYQNEVIETQAEKLLGLRDEKAELQKRVQFLEQELGAWKGKSIAAMINGMCKQCGKEPWQAIVSDKDGYALLHCFGCGANKYELVGEQALKVGKN